MSPDLARGAPAPADALADGLKRTELQRHALSVPGREVVQVLAAMQVQGRPTLTLHAGDAFLMPPRPPHNAIDVGPRTGRMLSTYIVEIDRPLATFTR